MTLFVAHVNEQATEDDLRKLFEPFGAITDIDKKRTYAFIDYADIESTDSAIKALHNMEFMGSKLRVEVSNKTRGDDGPSLGDLQEQCYHCKEIGHIAKNCPQLHQQSSSQQQQQQQQKPRPQKQIATSANESLYMQMFSQKQQKPPRSARMKRVSKGDSWLTNPYQKQKLTTKGDPRLYAKDHAPASDLQEDPSMTGGHGEQHLGANTFRTDPTSSQSSSWIEAPKPKMPLADMPSVPVFRVMQDEYARVYAEHQKAGKQISHYEVAKQAAINLRKTAHTGQGLGIKHTAALPTPDKSSGSSITQLPRPPPPLPPPQLLPPYQPSGSAYPNVTPPVNAGGSMTDKETTMTATPPAGSYRFPSPHQPSLANLGGAPVTAGMMLPVTGPTYSPQPSQVAHAYHHPPHPPPMPPLPPPQQSALIIAQPPPTPLPQPQPQPAANLPVAAAHTVESSHYPPGTVVYLPVITVLPGSSSAPKSASTTPTQPAQQYTQFHSPPIPGSMTHTMPLYSHVQMPAPSGARPPPPPPLHPPPLQMPQASTSKSMSPGPYDYSSQVMDTHDTSGYERERNMPADDYVAPLPSMPNFTDRYTSSSRSRRGSLASSTSGQGRSGRESRGDQSSRGRSRSPSRHNHRSSERQSDRSRSREPTSRRR